jgi:hypothetical protein
MTMFTRITFAKLVVLGVTIILLCAFMDDAALRGDGLTREQAVEIVRKEVHDAIHEPNPVPLEIDASKNKDGHWIVVVWYLPAGPGRFSIYILDNTGRILRCRHGDA